MPTTGNLNQDSSAPSEESVLPENSVAFEPPTTEMSSTTPASESPPPSQEDVVVDPSGSCDAPSVVASSSTLDSHGHVPMEAVEGSHHDMDSNNKTELFHQYEEQFSGNAITTTTDSIGSGDAQVSNQTPDEMGSNDPVQYPPNVEEACSSEAILNSGATYPTEQDDTPVELHPTGQDMMDVDPGHSSLHPATELTATSCYQTNASANTTELVQPGDDQCLGISQSNQVSSDSFAELNPSQTTTTTTTVSECTESTSYTTSAPIDEVTYSEQSALPEASVTDVCDTMSSEFVSEQPAEPEVVTQTHDNMVPTHSLENEVGNDTLNKGMAMDNESAQIATGDGIDPNNVMESESLHPVATDPSENTAIIETTNETDACTNAALASNTIEDDLDLPKVSVVSHNQQSQPSNDQHQNQTASSSSSSSFSMSSSSNSFQSAFAAFAGAPSVVDPQMPSVPAMEVDQSTSSPLSSPQVIHSTNPDISTTQPEAAVVESVSASDNVASAPAPIQESKKISVLPMPGQAMTMSEPATSSYSSSAVVSSELGIDQTNSSILQQENTTLEDPGNQNQEMTMQQPETCSESTAVASDAVYFIQVADASGEVVPQIIDPSEIASYADSAVYKQCMGADGQIETTVVASGGMVYQEEQAQTQVEAAPPTEPQSEMEQQVIYAHDLNGQLTPIDSAQSATDVAPPGKQFVYMQDSSGRIIRTIMDANQTMVPGQQVYYTQSDDGKIITSVMDSESGEQQSSSTTSTTTSAEYQQQQQVQDTGTQDGVGQQQLIQQQQHAAASGFAMDNSMSGLSMLAELSHLTAGQAPVDLKGSSSTDNSNSQDADMDEFRPVAMITRRVPDAGLDTVNSDLAGLKVAGGHGEPPSESQLAKLTAEINGGSIIPPASVSRDNLFVQWQNLDAMCWMDVVLIMLVYSPSLQPLVNMDPSHEFASTLLITLLKANRQAQVLLQNLLKKSEENSGGGLHNGSGITTTATKEAKTSKLVCKENMDEIGKAINILYAMREQIWQALQPRLQCERGKHNSPVLVLPLLVREKPMIKQMFTMKFRYVFKCGKCGYSQDDTHSKILPTIPAVPVNFNMKEPCFVRNCFECKAPNQRMHMKFEGLQDFVQMHFVKGLPHNRFEELSFDHNNDHYEVTAVVHYKNNPDHFIAWVRNAPGNTWMECDDLKSVITRYQSAKPLIPPSQVHMVMWERRLTPQHIQVMRETEDTRILSSLVLTVQQPGQEAAKPPPSNISQLPASSVLSGLMSQSQHSSSATNFSPYTPRGGRGSRGARGRGSRGRGTTSGRRGGIMGNTPTITTTTVSNQPRAAGQPQIIRLPLSALQGQLGSQIRGATGVSGGAVNPTPQRVILMGGNNSTSGSAATIQTVNTTTNAATGNPQTTQKKVVVLRSQDGSAGLGQLSAQQLLQLLQRTGAISGTNTRITTTISKASSDGTTQQQTITLTPGGPVSGAAASIASSSSSIIASPVTAIATTTTSSGLVTESNVESIPASNQTELVTPSSAESETTSETQTPMEVDSAAGIETQSHTGVYQTMQESDTSSQSATNITTMETRQQADEGNETCATNITSLPINNSSFSMATAASTTSTAPILELNQSKPSTLTLNSNTLRNLTRTGLGDGGTRYVQIPNPKGGPNIMTQLIMRGDKMMLVPVDKSTVSQNASAVASSTSILSSSPLSLSSSLSTNRTQSSLVSSSSLLSAALQAPTTITTSALSSSSSSSSSTRYITIPGSQGGAAGGATGKRTIQLISVPKGSSASAAGATRTLILGGQGSSSHSQTLSSCANTATRIISQSTQPSGDITGITSPQQQQHTTASGNIIIRELKRPDEDTSVSMTLSGESGTQTPLHTPSSAISLLRDMSTKPGVEDSKTPQGISILSPNRNQESFKYILPGSNNSQQIASIQTMTPSSVGGTAHQLVAGNKAFTALSASGTIIGGQLTTVNAGGSADMSSPVESMMMDTGVQSLYPELDAINPTVITTTHSTRGKRGGRGSRGARGGSRGRGYTKRGGRGGDSPGVSNQHLILGGQHHQPQQSGTISMLPSDFHGVGGQIIQTSMESVDGVPVVSIPDFSSSNIASSATDNTAVQQIEQPTQAITESSLGSNNTNTIDQLSAPLTASSMDNVVSMSAPLTASSMDNVVSMSSPLHSQEFTTDHQHQTLSTNLSPAISEGPRVITQTIPSIKANHGFDILTQGILGSVQPAPPPSSSSVLGTPRKTGISLLTGKQVSSPPACNLFPSTSLLTSSSSSSSSSLLVSDMTKMQQTLAMGHSVSQNEIDTLIKAAQGAARPPKPGQKWTGDEAASAVNTLGVEGEVNQSKMAGFNVDDFLSGGAKHQEDKLATVESVTSISDKGHRLEDGGSYSTEDSNSGVTESMEEDVSGKQQQEKRVFSVDESQVSAAERYRMPTELFQPDEESPEKPVRSDSISRQRVNSSSGAAAAAASILGGVVEDLPSKLFHDSEMSSQDDEIVKSPNVVKQSQSRQSMDVVDASQRDSMNSPRGMKSPDASASFGGEEDVEETVVNDVEQEEDVEETVVKDVEQEEDVEETVVKDVEQEVDVAASVVEEVVNVSECVEKEVPAAKAKGKSRRKSSGSRSKRRGSKGSRRSVTSESEDSSLVVDPSPSLSLSPRQVGLSSPRQVGLSSPRQVGLSSPIQKEQSGEKQETMPLVGGFASDILRDIEDKEKLVEESMEIDETEKVVVGGEEINDAVASGEEVVVEERDEKVETGHHEMKERDEVQESVVAHVEKEEEMKKDVVESSKVCGGEEKDSVVISPEKKVGKENMSPPVSRHKRKRKKRLVVAKPKAAVVVNKKQMADWSLKEDIDETSSSFLSSKVFSYRLLTRRVKKASRRHPSLGPTVTSYTTDPEDYFLDDLMLRKKKEDVEQLLACVVKRRRAKALERPKVDPCKEPTVIPLVPEDDADPACMFGGSVVTIPGKGEVFKGVVVKGQQRETADWNNGGSVVFDEEEGESNDDSVMGGGRGGQWEDKEAWMEYVETMWTSMCMELGFENFFGRQYRIKYGGSGSKEEEEEDEDEDDEEESEILTGEEDEENDFENVVSVNGGDLSIVSETKGDGKRKLDNDENTGGEDSKRMRHSSGDEEEKLLSDISVSIGKSLQGIVTGNNVSTSVTTSAAAAIVQQESLISPTKATTLPPLSPTETVSTHASSTVTHNISSPSSSFSTSRPTTAFPPKSPVVTSTSYFNGFSKSELPSVSTLPFPHKSPQPPAIPSSSPPSSSILSPVVTSSISQSAISSSSSSKSSSKKHSGQSLTSTSSSSSSPSFISPARRSSRTPIPSLKIRDSLEEGSVAAMKILNMSRRSSLVSSDEDGSAGYSSDEVLAMKKKTKKFHVSS